MTKRIILLISMVFFLIVDSAVGQETSMPIPLYTTSIGLKLGNNFQVSSKTFVNSDMALDLSVGFSLNNSGTIATLVFEYHHDTKFDNMIWYYGGGPAFVVNRFVNDVGVSTIFGGEIVTTEKLVNIFAEVQPTVLTQVGNGLIATGLEFDFTILVSFGARYIIL